MKHTFLAKYVEGTRRAREKFKQRVYVALFCGPDRIQVKGETMTRPGGAQVAWQHSRRDRADFTACLVGDLDAARASTCTERLLAMGAPARAFPGAAEATVDQVLKVIPSNALCLAYLDPYNLEYLSFSVIEKLARLTYIDFAVHFSTMNFETQCAHGVQPGACALGGMSCTREASLSRRRTSEFALFWPHDLASSVRP